MQWHSAAPGKQGPASIRRAGPDVLARGAAVVALVLIALLDLGAANSRRIIVRTDDGVTLGGTYFEASRRPAPGVVLLHMLTRTHEDWAAAGARLADAGYAVVAIDFRNGGD